MSDTWQDEAHRRLGDYPQCSYIVEDAATLTGVGTTWTGPAWFTPEQPVIDFLKIRQPAEVYEPGAETGKPCWKLMLVEVREEEIEGLDRPAFRDLVRRKLQQVGDDLLAAWEERQGG